MKHKQISPEEQAANLMEASLKELRRQTQTEPTVFYEIGTDVDAGNFEKSTVVDVLDDGRIYKIHHVIKERHGKVIIAEHDRYVAWHAIMKLTDTKDSLRAEETLFIQYSQRDIFGLLNTFYHFGIDTEPDYQRGNVWSLNDKINLIDSIFQNIDIGKFVFIQRPYDTEGALYEVLDGKQRLQAIVDFYEGRFSYKGRTIHDLSYADRHHFTSYSIPWGGVSSLDGSDTVTDVQKYKYFLKLNTGGKFVDPEHIKKVQAMLEETK